MNLKQKAYCCQKMAIAAAPTLLLSIPAAAQIIPDATLPANSIVTPNGNTLTIEGGSRAGGNLFHSFQEFSLTAGREAFFNNAIDVQNIFTRVTGSNISHIDGLIRANGTANLFLLNPNGIIFGPNARLNIGGSFVATTANAIGWANGNIFSANADNQTPNQLLNINPNALLFNQMTAQIVNRSVDGGTGLQVPAGRSLILAGGDIFLEGGRLETVGGRIELAALAPTATIGLNGDGTNLSLNVPAGIGLGNISLNNEAIADVSGTPGGTIVVNAQNLNMTGGSILTAGMSGIGSPQLPAGNIEINVPGTININASGLLNSVATGAIGNAGNINITTGSLFVTNGGFISAATRGKGNAGNVNIQAANTVSFDGVDSNGNSSLASVAAIATAVGNAGNLNITTGSLSLTNGAFLSTATLGKGNSGNLNINANTVSLDGVSSNNSPSFISTAVNQTAVGNAGNLNITTGSLSLTNGAFLSAGTLGQGNGGNININADAVTVDGFAPNGSPTFVYTGANLVGEGNAGDLNITTGTLSVTNGAYVTATTLKKGNAGNVNINANTVYLDGVGINENSTFISTIVGNRGEGNPGNININANELFVTNGAFVSAATQGKGNGGSVNINANSIYLDGVGSNSSPSFITTAVNRTALGDGGDINIKSGLLSVTNGARVTNVTVAPGNGGNININTNRLVVLSGGQILTTTFNNGRAGNITIDASDNITLAGSNPEPQRINENIAVTNGPASGIFASTIGNATGQGGNLQISTPALVVTDGAQVSVSSQGTGGAGNLTISAGAIRLNNSGSFKAETQTGSQSNIILNADSIVLRGESNITTNASSTATGGNITIDTNTLVALENSDITANAMQGRGGNISINTNAIFGTQFRPQQTPASDITASSQVGLSGTVAISNPQVENQSFFVELPPNAIATSEQITKGCPADKGNTFTIAGRGGLPEDPNSGIIGRAIWWDDRDLSTRRQEAEGKRPERIMSLSTDRNQTAFLAQETLSQTATNPEIVEATGWKINPQGQVELVADVGSSNSWVSPVNCQIMPRSRSVPGGGSRTSDMPSGTLRVKRSYRVSESPSLNNNQRSHSQ